MNGLPYSRLDAEKLILRDELAIDRTLLANERTLMAYLRSGMTMIIASLRLKSQSMEETKDPTIG